MRRLRIAPRAQADLTKLVAYVARQNPYAAARLAERLRVKSDLLVDFPGIGTIDRRQSGRRIHIVGDYLILYREDQDGITVLRYLHGRRDLRRIT